MFMRIQLRLINFVSILFIKIFLILLKIYNTMAKAYKKIDKYDFAISYLEQSL